MKAIVLCLSLTVLAVSARAGVIFDNGASRNDGGLFSDFDYPRQSVDDFWLSPGANTITDVHWWGHYDLNEPLPALDDWTIRIFANHLDDYAEINWLHEYAIGDVGRSLTATVGELEYYEFSAFIPALTLEPNTLYWLSIVANTANENTNFRWSTSIAGQGFHPEQRNSDGVDWFNPASNTQLAFRLTNDNVVPLPSTLALFALGLLGLTVRRRTA